MNDTHAAFAAAIDYAIDRAGVEASTFLQLWREGCWSEIREEFPDFEGPFPEERAVEGARGF